MRILCTLTAVCFSVLLCGQVNYDTRTVNEPYDGPFRPGTNLGYWPNFSQQELGSLSARVGGRVVRPVLAESVLDIFGFDVAVENFEHWESLGMGDFIATLGYPVDWHRDWTEYCPGTPSTMFANLYTPIWDNGENGTPYNDENYFASYVYRVVTIYTPYVTFWEIWNEPGFDETFNLGWRDPGDPNGNWWDNDPQPCDYILKAPIEHYVRTLRIAYEVIKTIAPEDKVLAGGFGFQSFLDAVLRNTDNPAGGSVTPEYPTGGGAYFEMQTLHNYPHFDGSTISASNGIFERHSDRAAQGLIYRRDFFQEIYSNYGYDGITYPKKGNVCTEMNVPRAFDEDPDRYFASEVGQRNYLMKAFVTAIEQDIFQFHVFSIADKPGRPFGFDKMGLYQPIDSIVYGQEIMNPEGVAMRTTSDLLWETTLDSEHSAELNMPAGAKGYAFKREDGRFMYMLWAETTEDHSEDASALYSFPVDLGIGALEKYEWNYYQSQTTEIIGPDNIELDATPIFLISDVVGDYLTLNCSPDIVVEAAIGETGAVVNWDIPELNTNCIDGFTDPFQVSGPDNGGMIPIGEYNIVYMASNNCGQNKTCFFTVKVLEADTDCFSQGIAPWNEWIEGVEFSNIYKESGKCDPSCGYADYTDLVAEGVKGETYDLILTPGLSYPTYVTNLFWTVWIDINGDGYFSDLNEKILEIEGGNQIVNTTITIDPDWPVGITKMRVANSKGEYAVTCEDIAKGEVEDYGLDIRNTTASCSLTASVETSACFDNGTIYDPNDDYYEVTLTVDGQGSFSDFWDVTNSAGFSQQFEYGVPVTLDPILMESGPMSLTIQDSENSNCVFEIDDLDRPGTCSDAPGPDCTNNVLINPSFESWAGWSFWFTAFYSTQEVQGSKGIRIDGINQRTFQWVEVSPGSNYALNGFTKLSHQSGIGKVGIRFLSVNWDEIAAYYVDITTQAYEPFNTLMVTTPPGASILEVTAINGSAVHSLYIDDFCLSQLPSLTDEQAEQIRNTPSQHLDLDGPKKIVYETPDLILYPNPANYSVNLDFRKLNTNAAELKVMNAVGELIYLEKIEGTQQLELSTANWSSGVYLIEINTAEGQREVERLVIQH